MVLCQLCEIEMGLKVAKDKKFRSYINSCHICGIEKDGKIGQTQAEKDIPKNTLYCENCPFSDNSNIADFIFGYQSSGYCYYLGKGDFSYINHTDLLWDGCKECGINEDIEVDYKFVIKNNKKILGIIQTDDDFWIGVDALRKYGVDDVVITRLSTLSVYCRVMEKYLLVSINDADKVLCHHRLYTYIKI